MVRGRESSSVCRRCCLSSGIPSFCVLGRSHSCSTSGRHFHFVSLARRVVSLQYRFFRRKPSDPTDQKRAGERGLFSSAIFARRCRNPLLVQRSLAAQPQTTENNGYHRAHVIPTCDRLGRSSTSSISCSITGTRARLTRKA